VFEARVINLCDRDIATVSKRRMEERVVGSTSSASNVHEAANDNTNPYRNMVMDAMRMN